MHIDRTKFDNIQKPNATPISNSKQINFHSIKRGTLGSEGGGVRV